MANRTPSVERDDDDDEGALFIKDGAPVKFCFHHSVTQGRRHITRDVERHGGQIVRDERHANVLLVDEQLDLALIRRRYYSSTERYRLTIYVEPRGFVQACIRAGTYRHVGPMKQGMPGRAPGAKRVRVEFTEDDRDQLARYLATRFPTRDGRMGNSAYKDLVQLGQTDDETWAWARRHTFHSWREHYKMNPDMMDARIAHHLAELKDVGHHFGHDPRRHNHRHIAREEEEEEEEEEEQEGRARARRRDRERREGVRRRRVPQEQQLERRAAGAKAKKAREHAARRERDRDELAEEEEEGEEEIQFVRHVKRQARHGRDAKQAKRARRSETPSEDDPADAQSGGSPPDKESEEQLPDIEGSDLFGDRMYGDEARFEFDDDDAIVFPMPSPPRTSPGLEQDGAPLSTQATLVASPFGVDSGAWSPLEHRRTVPPSSQPAVVVMETRERLVMSGGRTEGASPQAGPSVGRRSGHVVVEVPAWRPRAVVPARSVDVEPAPTLDSLSERREEEEGGGKEQEQELELDKGKGKARATEEVLGSIEEDELVGELEEEEDQLVSATSGLSAGETPEERDVEGLLEVRSEEDGDGENEGVRDQEDHEHDVVEDAVGDGDRDRENEGVHDQDDNDTVTDDEDGYMLLGLPSIQEVTMHNESQPTDSDDAETHGMLVRGIAGEFMDGDEGDAGQGSAEQGETEQEQERNEVPDDGEGDDEDEDRAKRTTRGSLRAARATVESRMVTRSKSATQNQTQTRTQTLTQVPTLQTGPTSPRRTRSRSRFHSTVLPSLGAKVRVEEEYVPPAGTRAAKAVRGKGE